MDELIIDPEFRGKIPPLTEEEFSLLEENILSDGTVFSPLIVWDGIILDGHNRYEIIQKHSNLTYAVHEMAFANRYEAAAWICKNQLGRRNLSPEQKKYLIGQRYEAEKHLDFSCGNQYTLSSKSGVGQSDPPQKTHGTRTRIAAETGTSESFVKRAGQFAQDVDAAEEVIPGIKQDILTGVIQPPQAAVAAVARAEPEERPRLAAALKKPREHKKPDSEKPQPAYHKAPPILPKQSGMKKIAEISAEMERPKIPAVEEGMIHSLDGETDSFIALCDRIFLECPRLLSDGNYRRKVIQIMRKLKQYILQIEGGRTE